MTRKELAILCRNWRISQGITQSEIADKAGVSAQAVSQFEAGTCNSLRIYCAYLDFGFKSSIEAGGAIMQGVKQWQNEN